MKFVWTVTAPLLLACLLWKAISGMRSSDRGWRLALSLALTTIALIAIHFVAEDSPYFIFAAVSAAALLLGAAYFLWRYNNPPPQRPH